MRITKNVDFGLTGIRIEGCDLVSTHDQEATIDLLRSLSGHRERSLQLLVEIEKNQVIVGIRTKSVLGARKLRFVGILADPFDGSIYGHFEVSKAERKWIGLVILLFSVLISLAFFRGVFDLRLGAEILFRSLYFLGAWMCGYLIAISPSAFTMLITQSTRTRVVELLDSAISVGSREEKEC